LSTILAADFFGARGGARPTRMLIHAPMAMPITDPRCSCMTEGDRRTARRLSNEYWRLRTLAADQHLRDSIRLGLNPSHDARNDVRNFYTSRSAVAIKFARLYTRIITCFRSCVVQTTDPVPGSCS
jgi:hypothetical protein